IGARAVIAVPTVPSASRLPVPRTLSWSGTPRTLTVPASPSGERRGMRSRSSSRAGYTENTPRRRLLLQNRGVFSFPAASGSETGGDTGDRRNRQRHGWKIQGLERRDPPREVL